MQEPQLRDEDIVAAIMRHTDTLLAQDDPPPLDAIRAGLSVYLREMGQRGAAPAVVSRLQRYRDRVCSDAPFGRERSVS